MKFNKVIKQVVEPTKDSGKAVPISLPKYDSEGNFIGPLKCSVSRSGEGLVIGCEGFGTQDVIGGESIYLEYYDGRLILRVWSDINNLDPTHTIDLSGASESLRLVNKEDS